jgi:hypothetical protein
MTNTWPDASLDPVRRLMVMADAVRGARTITRVVDAPFDTVWTRLSDLEGDFGRIQPDMRHVRVELRAGEHVEALVRSRFGMRARLRGVLRPGWCWMQSRFLIIGMAAVQHTDGRTLVALTGGVRVPGQAAVIPLGAARESRRSLDRLERLISG